MTYTDPGDSNVHGERVPDSQDPAQVGLFGETVTADIGGGLSITVPRASLPRARSTDPKTSHDAAASMVEGAKAQRERILEILRERGPMNAYEIDKAIGWRETTAGRRLKELAHPNVGLVKMTVHTRATRSPQYQGHLWEVV